MGEVLAFAGVDHDSAEILMGEGAGSQWVLWGGCSTQSQFFRALTPSLTGEAKLSDPKRGEEKGHVAPKLSESSFSCIA